MLYRWPSIVFLSFFSSAWVSLCFAFNIVIFCCCFFLTFKEIPRTSFHHFSSECQCPAESPLKHAKLSHDCFNPSLNCDPWYLPFLSICHQLHPQLQVSEQLTKNFNYSTCHVLNYWYACSLFHGKSFVSDQIISDQLLSRAWLFATPWIAARGPPCPSPTPRVHWDSRPSSQWCHPAISSSVVPFSSCPQSLPESESFPMSQLFSWGGQSTGVSCLNFCNFFFNYKILWLTHKYSLTK